MAPDEEQHPSHAQNRHRNPAAACYEDITFPEEGEAFG